MDEVNKDQRYIQMKMEYLDLLQHLMLRAGWPVAKVAEEIEVESSWSVPLLLDE